MNTLTRSPSSSQAITRTRARHEEPPATAAELAEIESIRGRVSYHVASAWLKRFVLTHPRAKTKGLHLGVESVTVLFRSALKDAAAGRPYLTAALADPDLGMSVMVAVIDAGFQVAPRHGAFGKRLATNVREAVLFEVARSSWDRLGLEGRA